MRWTWRAVAASTLVAAVWLPYLGYLWQGGMPFIHDTRGMAGVGLVIGLAAWLIGGWDTGAWAAVIGALSLGWGVAASLTHNDTLLAVFIFSLAAVVPVAAVRHSPRVTTHRAGRRP